MKIASARLFPVTDRPLQDLHIESGRIARVEPAGSGQASEETFDTETVFMHVGNPVLRELVAVAGQQRVEILMQLAGRKV